MKKLKSLNSASKGLAGALAIAGGTSAYADIIVSTVPANSTVPVGGNVTIPWDVNNDGIVDFNFQNRYPNTTGVEWQVNMRPVAGNAVLGYGTGSTFRYGSAFTFGTSIGPVAPSGTAFQTVGQVIMGSVYAGTPYGGFAYPGAPGNGGVNPGNFSYAGFSFVVGGNTLYGWIRMLTNAGVVQFDSAAYQSTPNTPIAAGVPEPTTLAGLATGAALLAGAALRRRRKA